VIALCIKWLSMWGKSSCGRVVASTQTGNSEQNGLTYRIALSLLFLQPVPIKLRGWHNISGAGKCWAVKGKSVLKMLFFFF
jgi:hypothetical protein